MGDFDFKRALFNGWHDWLSFVIKGVVGLVNGLSWVLWGIVGGMLTILYRCFLFIKAVVKKYPVHTLALLCIVLCVLLLMNFVSYSARIKACEKQRDSIGYELGQLEQALMGDTIVIGMK